MNQPARQVTADAFLSSLRDRSAHGAAMVTAEGGEIPVLVQLQDSSTVIFTFSGAIDRAKRPLPCFTSTGLYKHVPASVIGIADPALARSETLKLAWYAGDENFALQPALTDLIERIVQRLDATRIVFAGGSGGGFAALYYSWNLPGSVAVVSNPQTNLNHAIHAHRDRYRAACWPSLPASVPLHERIDVDLGALYASRCDNSVIYLQESSDFLHLKWHFGPFITKLPRDYSDRLIIRMTHWGRRGHQAVPANVWISWTNAALTAPNTTATSIEETWSAQNSIEVPGMNGKQPPAPIPRAANRDEQIAARLASAATGAVLDPHSFERSPS